MTTPVPNHLPQLAVGSHAPGSGLACIMNAISYLNGDIEITDMPGCTDPMLARAAQSINDNLCQHLVAEGEESRLLLCSGCSHRMWLLGARLIGTVEATSNLSERERALLYVRLALWAAEQSKHLIEPLARETCEAALQSIRAFLDDPSVNNAIVAQNMSNATFILSRHADHICPIDTWDKISLVAIYAVHSAARAASVFTGGDFLVDRVALGTSYAVGAAGGALGGLVLIQDTLLLENWDSYADAHVQLFHRFVDEFERLTLRTTSSREWTREDYELVVRRSGTPVAS